MKYEQYALGDVLQFWFEELTPQDWFAGGVELDAKITERFADVHARVAAGEFAQYRTDAHSHLAEVIVLDQFSRQIYRNAAPAFVYDYLALALAQHAIAAGFDQQLENDARMFLYMPFMHSESSMIHTDAVKLFEALGNVETLKFEHIHKDIIDEFGRYPHRNETLGRESTTEEKDYLANNQEAFF
ncbi:MAG: hypothetical protein ACI9SY_000557 [Candidatus Paceibacteria bacterium]|jgi:uncharacterized protein (DUF924 family)